MTFAHKAAATLLAAAALTGIGAGVASAAAPAAHASSPVSVTAEQWRNVLLGQQLQLTGSW